MFRLVFLLLFGCILVHVLVHGHNGCPMQPHSTEWESRTDFPYSKELEYNDGECPRGMHLQTVEDMQFCVHTLFSRHLGILEDGVETYRRNAESFVQYVKLIEDADSGVIQALFKPKSDECNNKVYCFDGFIPFVLGYCNRTCMGVEATSRVFHVPPANISARFLTGCRLMKGCSALPFDEEDYNSGSIHARLKAIGVMDVYQRIYQGGTMVRNKGITTITENNGLTSINFTEGRYFIGGLTKGTASYRVGFDKYNVATWLPDVGTNEFAYGQDLHCISFSSTGYGFYLLSTPPLNCSGDAVAPPPVDGVFDVKIGCDYKRFTFRITYVDDFLLNDLIPFDYDYSWRVMLTNMPGNFTYDGAKYSLHCVCVVITTLDDGYDINGRFVPKELFELWELPVPPKNRQIAYVNAVSELTYIEKKGDGMLRCIVRYRG